MGDLILVGVGVLLLGVFLVGMVQAVAMFVILLNEEKHYKRRPR